MQIFPNFGINYGKRTEFDDISETGQYLFIPFNVLRSSGNVIAKENILILLKPNMVAKYVSIL